MALAKNLLALVTLSCLILNTVSGQEHLDGSRREAPLGPQTTIREPPVGQTAAHELRAAPTGADSGAQSSQAVTVYKQPSSWLVGLVREFFDDIDWQTINNASEQIEKFIRKVDRLVGSMRALLVRASGGQRSSDLLARVGTGQLAERSAAPSSRWWTSGWGKAATPSDDATSVKGMLERVACFVGYVRLMNLSNEALAELDASKVVSSLFNSNKRNSSSSWANWFG